MGIKKDAVARIHPGLKPRQFVVLHGENKLVEPTGEFRSFRLTQVGNVVDTLTENAGTTEALLSVRLDVNGSIECTMGGNFQYCSMIGMLEILKDYLMRNSLA